MAVGKCKKCAGQLASTADRCPHCGAITTVNAAGTAIGCIVVVALCIVVGLWAKGCVDGSSQIGCMRVILGVPKGL